MKLRTHKTIDENEDEGLMPIVPDHLQDNDNSIVQQDVSEIEEDNNCSNLSSDNETEDEIKEASSSEDEREIRTCDESSDNHNESITDNKGSTKPYVMMIFYYYAIINNFIHNQLMNFFTAIFNYSKINPINRIFVCGLFAGGIGGVYTSCLSLSIARKMLSIHNTDFICMLMMMWICVEAFYDDLWPKYVALFQFGDAIYDIVTSERLKVDSASHLTCSLSTLISNSKETALCVIIFYMYIGSKQIMNMNIKIDWFC